MFSLGDACRQEYMEILFLAAHGYGTGASKLLRGFYERAVALAYILKNRDKVERFSNFAAVQEYKAMKDALKQFLLKVSVSRVNLRLLMRVFRFDLSTMDVQMRSGSGCPMIGMTSVDATPAGL